MSLPVLIATIMRPEGDTGVQTHFRAFASWLVKLNYSIRVVTPFDSPKWVVYPTFAMRCIVDLLNSALSVWWYRHWHAVFLFQALRTSLSNGTPCIIYAQCPLSADAALRARVSPSQRVVMVVHFNVSQSDEWAGKGMIPVDGRLFNSIRLFELDVLPRLDGIVFVSDFMRRKLVSRIPALISIPYRVAPNFLADPGKGEANENVASDLICIGTLEPRKNQCYAVEIVAAARRLGRHLRLTLVGDGPDRDKLEALVKQYGIGSDVKFTGYVKQAAMMLNKHRACLHVAHIENLPVTLIEALSRGLPVFAPAVGGIPEVFDDAIEGRVIPLNNADVAAKLILEWLDSPSVIAKGGTLARKRFLRDFEADTVAKSLYEFLHYEDGFEGVNDEN